MQQIISQQLTTLTATIKRLNLSVSNILKKLENRDGQTWRTVVKYELTAVVGGIVTFAIAKLGM